LKTRIFTPRERELLSQFFAGKLRAKHPLVSQIRTRVKKFDELASDVQLYLRIRNFVEG
jgi:hypothetical protein